MTSLLNAVSMKQLSMINLLIQIPGSVTQQTLNDALILAAKNQQAEIVQLLLKGGADPNSCDKMGQSVLALMTSEEDGHGVKILLEHGSHVDEHCGGHGTALHYAARHGNVAAVQHLVDHGADVNSRDRSGATPLIVAVKQAQSLETIMRILLEHKADINAQDEQLNTALHYAVTRLRGIETLVKNGAKPDTPNEDGNTPLMFAATEGLCSIIRTMLTVPTDVNVRNCDMGKSALHIVAMKGHACCLREMLAAGGLVSITDNSGRTPLNDALDRDQMMTSRLLLQWNCDVRKSDIESLIAQRQYDLAKMLIVTAAITNEDIRQMAKLVTADDVEIIAWLDDVISSPPSLLHTSRLCIRRSLGALQFSWRSQQLLLPEYLRKVLFMVDLDYHSR